ncbi:uncharacterized protein LOC100841480 [Brachypodium distachyon]|uniref:Uncharacterized protein n=1 Tax=Brachypodium distachyon TaxID=15368 RepID=I1IU89_BRADI|nr:uncharacterized protein LOC100841480 [Brachypodium distachyon]PNT65422.1 hypothetical protein BRADI_4g42187v3 [Brachypodium distachyon]PNT65423.1 hypothetical protein BRADI_4g42187v3 [Brachypodium distachyon]|eukprot:XP_003578892.1 uncharacterized protein LOC100841480 [Brachypodium distachyon]
MHRLLLSRPPMPTPVLHTTPASPAADGDLLELDVLWPASSAPGLLAALPNDEAKKKKKRSGAGAGAGGPAAVRSAGRAIPEKAAAVTVPSAAAATARSAPVRIPCEARRGRWAHAVGGGGSDDGDAMVPPHEIVARRAAAHSSVLEGAGRTLKGRDLRRVRNAVLRRTGFLD